MAKLLVIDDDATLLDLLRVHLKNAGHTVRTAADAADGIRAILADPPELILSDVSMPYLDGFELLHALRSEPLTKRIPVIFLTGHDDDESLVKARALGVDEYLSKPIRADELLAAIDAALKKAPSATGLRLVN